MTWREARVISEPRPGLWAVRLTKGGVEVAARIFWTACPDCGAVVEPGSWPPNIAERSPMLAAEINGEAVMLDAVWLRRGRAISEAEYRWLLADRAWAKEHRPDDPAADPMRAVDRLTVKPPF